MDIAVDCVQILILFWIWLCIGFNDLSIKKTVDFCIQAQNSDWSPSITLFADLHGWVFIPRLRGMKSLKDQHLVGGCNVMLTVQLSTAIGSPFMEGSLIPFNGRGNHGNLNYIHREGRSYGRADPKCHCQFWGFQHRRNDKYNRYVWKSPFQHRGRWTLHNIGVCDEF